MKIISWNLCSTNKDQRSQIDYVLLQKPDITCMQEVNESTLEYLKHKDYDYHATRIALSKVPSSNVYKVIMSKEKISNKGEFHTRDKDANTIWEQLIKSAFRLKEVDYIGQFADIGNDIRIVNLHLESFISPKDRVQEFSLAVSNYNKGKTTIFCGDFNNYGIWYLNWIPLLLMKLDISHFLINERKEFEKIFLENNLLNLFKGRKTVNFLKLFSCQVDHILVPENIEVISKYVDTLTHGSDHNMIIADINN